MGATRTVELFRQNQDSGLDMTRSAGGRDNFMQVGVW